MDNGSVIEGMSLKPDAIEDDDDPSGEVISCTHVLGAEYSGYEGWGFFTTAEDREIAVRHADEDTNIWDFAFCPKCGERLVVDTAP